MIREYDSSGGVGFEDDVIMLSPPDILSSRLVHSNAAAHTEVDHQRLTAVEICHDVLRPPPQPLHTSTCQPTFEILGKWNPKIAAAGFHRGQPASFHSGLEAALYGFDFGQFRHEAILTILCYAGLRRIVRSHDPGELSERKIIAPYSKGNSPRRSACIHSSCRLHRPASIAATAGQVFARLEI